MQKKNNTNIFSLGAFSLTKVVKCFSNLVEPCTGVRCDGYYIQLFLLFCHEFEHDPSGAANFVMILPADTLVLKGAGPSGKVLITKFDTPPSKFTWIPAIPYNSCRPNDVVQNNRWDLAAVQLLITVLCLGVSQQW